MLAQLPFWRENTASKHELIKKQQQQKKNSVVKWRDADQRRFWLSLNKAFEKLEAASQ